MVCCIKIASDTLYLWHDVPIVLPPSIIGIDQNESFSVNLYLYFLSFLDFF